MVLLWTIIPCNKLLSNALASIVSVLSSPGHGQCALPWYFTKWNNPFTSLFSTLHLPPPYTYSEGELMETCMLKAGEAMCPEKRLDRCHTSNSHFQLSRWSTGQGRNGLGLCYQPSYRWHALNDQEKSRCCDKIQRESTDCKWRTWYWTFYCILRQEPLCCKTLKMDHVTEVIVWTDYPSRRSEQWQNLDRF